ncbi:unnamed protein product [Cochlearia groenlandica]
MGVLRHSCFGKLFDLPVSRCLPCGKFPNATLNKDAKDSGKPSYWSELLGENVNLTIYDLLEMFIQESDMPRWKKIKIALLIIVDGFIVCNSQFGRITPQYVEWLSDMEFLLSYPWDLIVHPFIDGNDLNATNDYTWDDDIQDPKIDYLEQLLKDGHNFHSEEWSTLNTSMPCIDLVRKHEKEKVTQSTVSRSSWQPKNSPHIAQIDSTTEQRISAMIDDLKEWVGL